MGGLHLRLAEQHDEPVPAGVRRRASAAARQQQSRERSGKRARPGGAAPVEPVGQVDHEVRREAMRSGATCPVRLQLGRRWPRPPRKTLIPLRATIMFMCRR